MNKVFNLLLTLGLALAGFTQSWARYWTYDSTVPLTADKIQPNTPYVLQPGFAVASSTPWFLESNNFINSHNLQLSQVFEFVPAGDLKDTDGDPVYYLQRKSTGEYLSDPTNGQFYTNQIERAWKLVVRDAHYENLSEFTYSWTHANDAGEEVVEELKGFNAWLRQAKEENNPEQAMLKQLSSNPQAETGALVITSFEPVDKNDAYTEYKFFLTFGKDNPASGAAKATDYARNAWVIYPALQQSAKDALEAIVNEVLGGTPNIAEKLQNFTRGTGAGEYSPEIYAELEATWTKIEQVQAGTLALPDEEVDKLATDFRDTYYRFIQSGKPLTEGYYLVYSLRPNTPLFPSRPGVYPYSGNGSGYDLGALYDGAAVNPTDKRLCWTVYKKDAVDIELETFQADRTNWKNAKFVWKVVNSGKTDRTGNPLFYFQNLSTGQYIGKAAQVSVPINMTASPEVAYTISTSQEFPGYFNFYSPELPVVTEWGAPTPATYSGLHSRTENRDVVAWDSRVGGSCWKVITITAEEVDAILRNAELPKRQAAMASLITKAEDAIEAGRAYVGVDATGATIPHSQSGELPAVDGLVTDVAQLVSPMKETSEGTMEALLDADPTTYFHSTWQGGGSAWLGGHYLQMTLNDPETTLYVKWAKRINGTKVNDNGAPAKVVFWGTNDASKLEVTSTDVENEDGTTTKNFDAWKQQWDSLATATFKYPYEVQVNGTAVPKAAGAAFAALGKPYKYIRMEVVTRVNDASLSGGNKFFHGSELRVYKGQYDPSNSMIESVPADVLKELQQQLAAAKALQAKGEAPAGQIDALQKAYDEFLKNYPDPDRLKTAITAAKAQATAAVEGTALGYYKEGAKAAYEAAIAEVEAGLAAAGKLPTAKQVLDLMAKLDAATSTFDAALLVPTSGYYIIESASNSAVNNKRKLYAASSARSNNTKAEGFVMGGGRQKAADSNAYEDNPEFATNLSQFWEVTKQDTGLVVRNLFTGLYLAPVANAKKVTLAEQPYVLPYRFKEAGCFNFLIPADKAVSGTFIYVNLDPSTGKLVTWNAADGRDNSAFSFIPVEDEEINKFIQEGFNYELRHPGKMEIITLPIDAQQESGFYTVIGQNPTDNSIQLKKADTKLKAGQAYVYVPVEGSTAKTVQLFAPEATVATLKPIWKPLPAVNGIQGAFDFDEVPVASGLFDTNRTKVLLSEEGDRTEPNAGYFTRMPETTEKGDLEIAANGTITKIDHLLSAPAASQQGIYNLQGVRLNSTKHLPAGVYVVNGKKMVVK